MRARNNGAPERRPARLGGRPRLIRRVLGGIFVFNVVVATAKLGYGLSSNSVGMSADGLNSLMDAMSNVVEIVGVSIAARPPDRNHPYGHRRYETVTSLGIVVFMALALEEILRRAWENYRGGIPPEVTTTSFVVMLVTLALVLGATMLARTMGRRLGSSILLAEARHLASDVVVSISVIAGLVAVRLGFPHGDLVVALFVAGVIAWAAWSIIRDSALALTDATVVESDEIKRIALSVPGVLGVHNVRTRGSEGVILSDLHIQVDPELHVSVAHEIASQVAAKIEESLHRPADVTVHIEPAAAEHLRPERGHHPQSDRDES
jgi:cation diffusion facilitator family transporter